MTELELLTLARSANDNITSDFAQLITINFAMVIAIYYFLNRARLGMKLFAFAIYLIGSLMYRGVMLEEANVMAWTLEALKAMPQDKLSYVTVRYLGLRDTWLGQSTSVLKNLALWVLPLGMGWLLFFWKRGPDQA
jgi:hypothetical protein